MHGIRPSCGELGIRTARVRRRPTQRRIWDELLLRFLSEEAALNRRNHAARQPLAEPGDKGQCHEFEIGLGSLREMVFGALGTFGDCSRVLRCCACLSAKKPPSVARHTFHVDDGDFAIEVIVDTTDPSGPFMELIHKTRDDREGDRIVSDRIRLLWTVPAYGGRRWWFQCPRTARRTSQTADSISGAARATASATPANARDASIGFSDGPRC